MENDSAIKENELLQQHKWTYRILSEICQTEKERDLLVSLLCRIYTAEQMNKQENRNGLIDPKNMLVVAEERGLGA